MQLSVPAGFLFLSVLLSCHPHETEQKRTVCFVFYNEAESNSFDFLSQSVRKFYGLKTRILPSRNLPPNAYYASRNRYRADSLLSDLSRIADPDCIIAGITDRDISVSMGKFRDWGVFGYGECPGKVSISSVYRLKKNSADKKRIQLRLKNVLLHEIGHNLGLPHCPDTTCLMTDARGKLSSVEGSNRSLCVACQNKIK